MIYYRCEHKIIFKKSNHLIICSAPTSYYIPFSFKSWCFVKNILQSQIMLSILLRSKLNRKNILRPWKSLRIQIQIIEYLMKISYIIANKAGAISKLLFFYSFIKILLFNSKVECYRVPKHTMGARSLSAAGHDGRGLGFDSRSTKFRLTNGPPIVLLPKYRFLHYSFLLERRYARRPL